MNNGGPAFPQYGPTEGAYDRTRAVGGMTLRDWFAGQAIAGRAGPGVFVDNPERLAADAYDIADALIAEKLKREAKEAKA